jgi:hypothetical protein
VIDHPGQPISCVNSFLPLQRMEIVDIYIVGAFLGPTRMQMSYMSSLYAGTGQTGSRVHP